VGIFLQKLALGYIAWGTYCISYFNFC